MPPRSVENASTFGPNHQAIVRCVALAPCRGKSSIAADGRPASPVSGHHWRRRIARKSAAKVGQARFGVNRGLDHLAPTPSARRFSILKVFHEPGWSFSWYRTPLRGLLQRPPEVPHHPAGPISRPLDQMSCHRAQARDNRDSDPSSLHRHWGWVQFADSSSSSPTEQTLRR